MLELWQIITIIVVLLVVLTLAIIIFASKKKNKVKIDDSFLDILITSLGGLTNIISVDVDNKRIKFAVNNVNLTHPNDLKDKLNASGVVISGKTIKALFSYDAVIIKDNLDKKLKK